MVIIILSGRNERESVVGEGVVWARTRRRSTGNANACSARAFAPEAQGWLELWAIWHGWCRNEGAISLHCASEISSRYAALN